MDTMYKLVLFTWILIYTSWNDVILHSIASLDSRSHGATCPAARGPAETPTVAPAPSSARSGAAAVLVALGHRFQIEMGLKWSR